MSDLTRRGFVKSSAGTAAGIAAVGVLAVPASSDASTATDAHATSSEPVIAYVKDPRKGEIAVMSGDREVVIRDRKLASQIARAAR